LQGAFAIVGRGINSDLPGNGVAVGLLDHERLKYAGGAGRRRGSGSRRWSWGGRSWRWRWRCRCGRRRSWAGG
jgi:hypothetical protein